MNEKQTPRPRNKKHRANLQRVFEYLGKAGPSTSMKITECVRTKGGTKPRMFPTTNQLSNLLRRDERFLCVNQRQQTLKGHSTITWGIVGVHENQIDKVEHNTSGGSRDWR